MPDPAILPLPTTVAELQADVARLHDTIALLEQRLAVVLVNRKRDRDGHDFGYKDMTEHCGPYYYDCPLSLLEMTDEPTGESAIAWRKKVRDYHAAKKARAKPAAGLVIQYGKFPRVMNST